MHRKAKRFGKKRIRTCDIVQIPYAEAIRTAQTRKKPKKTTKLAEGNGRSQQMLDESIRLETLKLIGTRERAFSIPRNFTKEQRWAPLKKRLITRGQERQLCLQCGHEVKSKARMDSSCKRALCKELRNAKGPSYKTKTQHQEHLRLWAVPEGSTYE